MCIISDALLSILLTYKLHIALLIVIGLWVRVVVVVQKDSYRTVPDGVIQHTIHHVLNILNFFIVLVIQAADIRCISIN